MTETKICTKCGIEKDLGEFNKNAKYKDGLMTHCKTCRRKYEKEWRDKNPEKCRRRKSVYYSRHKKEEARKNKEYRMENDGLLLDKQFQRRYSISLEEYNKMLESQGGRCKICGEECGTGRRLAVDHDHDTNEVRGLLCKDCNTGLGSFKDSAFLLRQAEAYLEGDKSETDTADIVRLIESSFSSMIKTD